jgi:hypothetical protein
LLSLSAAHHLPPPTSTCNSYYVTAAEGSAWQALYNNTDGLRDSWAQYWALLAGLWKGEPTVLGYELINEPFAGDVIKYPELLVPGAADANNLVRCELLVISSLQKDLACLKQKWVQCTSAQITLFIF